MYQRCVLHHENTRQQVRSLPKSAVNRWKRPWSSAWWWTAVLTPIVTLQSGALQDLHSDYVAAVMRTTNNPGEYVFGRVFYWPELVLAWSWDAGLTARLNALIRVGSFVYCVIWLCQLVSVSTKVREWKLCVGAVLGGLYWISFWPELGDSLVYSGTSLGVFVFLATLGEPSKLQGRPLTGRIWIVRVIASFIAAATYVHSLFVILPLTLYLVVGARRSVTGLKTAIRDLLLHLAAVGLGAGLAVVRLTLSETEETGITTFGLLTKIRATRHLWNQSLYLWDSLRLSVVFLAVSLVLFLWRRNVETFGLAIVGFLTSLSIVPMASLKHVQANVMMPRYFAAQITLGLLLQLLSTIAAIDTSRKPRTTMEAGRANTKRLQTFAKAALVTLGAVFLIQVSVSPLEFGLAYRDQSYNTKASKLLSHDQVEYLEKMYEESGLPVLVFFGYWDLYPNVMLLDEAGLSAYALEGVPIFDYQQRRFASVMRSMNYDVLCDRSFAECRQNLRTVLKRREFPLGIVSDGGTKHDSQSPLSLQILNVRADEM